MKRGHPEYTERVKREGKRDPDGSRSMVIEQRPDPKVARNAVLFSGFVILTIAVFALFLGSGCGGSEEPANAHAEQPAAQTEAASTDSMTVESESDSVVADQEEAGGNFLTRLFNRGEGEEEEEEEAVPVELAIVDVCDIPSYMGATATLEPEKRAQLLAKINGEILKILVEEGDWVREGDVLAILDGKAQRVALEEAEARSRAMERDLERARALHDQEFNSDKDLLDAQSQFEQADAQRKAIRLQLDYTRIVAPYTGQVAERHVDPGQAVAPGSALFTIVDPDPLQVKIHIPEAEARKLTAGQNVVITHDNEDESVVSGEVLRIAPVVDSRTGTVKITCNVTGSNPSLRPGSFVRVKIETNIHKDVLVIPKRALIPEGAETYVYKAVEDSVVKVPVTTSYTDDTRIEIVDGLSAGEKVVTVGQGALKSGSKIEEIKRHEQTDREETPDSTTADTEE